MEDPLKSSMRFFSDQQLCYADILSPPEARNLSHIFTFFSVAIIIMILIFAIVVTEQVLPRIEVAVLNFLRILTSSSPAISDLPLVLISTTFRS